MKNVTYVVIPTLPVVPKSSGWQLYLIIAAVVIVAVLIILMIVFCNKKHNNLKESNQEEIMVESEFDIPARSIFTELHIAVPRTMKEFASKFRLSNRQI